MSQNSNSSDQNSPEVNFKKNNSADLAFRKQSMQSYRLPLMSFAVLMVAGVIFDFALNAYLQLSLIYIFVNVILAMSLNLVNGYTGQFSLGHAGFMAIGAYTSAYLSMKIAPMAGLSSIFSFILYSIAGGIMSAGFGWVVGLPSLRLKGDYLAIVTLGFGEIIRVMVLNTEALGGARGMYGIPGTSDIILGGLTLSRFFGYYFISSVWVIIAFFYIWRLVNSTHGRAFKSVREDEIATESIGIDTTQIKVKAFVISSFFAGVAGSLFAHYSNYLNPATFSFVMSINVVIMVVLGGMGSMTGPILAAVLVTILPEALRPLQELTGKDLRMVVYSLTLVVLMLVRPQGLMGQNEVWNMWRKKK
jgi:branched-chain amino acid transport system permease protein